MAKLIAQQAASGQTATRVLRGARHQQQILQCAKNKLAIDADRKSTKKTTSKFITVSTQPFPPAAIALHIGAVQLRIPADSTPQWLAALIRELN